MQGHSGAVSGRPTARSSAHHRASTHPQEPGACSGQQPGPEADEQLGEVGSAGGFGPGLIVGTPHSRLAQAEDAVVQHEQQGDAAQAEGCPPDLRAVEQVTWLPGCAGPARPVSERTVTQ